MDPNPLEMIKQQQGALDVDLILLLPSYLPYGGQQHQQREAAELGIQQRVAGLSLSHGGDGWISDGSDWSSHGGGWIPMVAAGSTEKARTRRGDEGWVLVRPNT